MRDLAFIFTTLERDDAARRCIESIRENFPVSPIYVADQSEMTEEKIRFYEENRVNYYRLPFDAGLSFARNFLVDKVKEPYLLLGDDDFIHVKNSNIDSALEIVRNDPEIGILGGRVVDIEMDSAGSIVNRRERFYEHAIVYRQDLGLLALLPLKRFSPPVRTCCGHSYLLCDVVLNFAIMRKDLFESKKVHWNEEIKIFGEHEDFYLRMHLYSEKKVAYFPEMNVLHHRVLNENYGNYRYRKDGLRVLGEEWGVTQIFEPGVGVRYLTGDCEFKSDGPLTSVFSKRWYSHLTRLPIAAVRWLKRVKR